MKQPIPGKLFLFDRGSLEEYLGSHANLMEMEPSEPYRFLRI